MNRTALAVLVLLASLATEAQIKHIEMRVEGMTWNFWAYGVKQHLGRQFGVQKVEVSLLDGKVEVTPKEDGGIDPAQLLKATYDSGVSVAEMDMTAEGKIVKDDSGGLSFQVEANRIYPLEPNDLSKGLEPLAGTQTLVAVRGQLYKKPSGKKRSEPATPLRLLILEVQKKD
jgi:hypothetical protein